MSNNHLKEVKFDFIRYANCWEDADVLLSGLNIQAGDRILSIASAGDNVFALLSKNPAQVVAVDISPVQLYLCELKKEAIQHLNYNDFIAFLGFSPCKQRTEIYRSIRKHLGAECQQYWDQQQIAMEAGIIHFGKFEQYFQLFKSTALPKVHNREKVAQLLQPKKPAEQKAFYDHHWNTPSWREMYAEFFGIQMMGEHGRDPAFLKHVKGSVPNIILQRESQHLSTTAAFENYFLHYILNNRFEPDCLPYYARKEHFESIKNNLNALEFRQGLLQDVLESNEQFNGFNLSDIFEYMSDLEFEQQAAFFEQISASHARLVYWNLMIPRKLSSLNEGCFQLKEKLIVDLKLRDKGYFYGDLIVEEKR